MRQDLRWRAVVIFILVVVCGLLLGPLGSTLYGVNESIRLGLDLKGGIELLLAPDYRLGGNQLNKLGEALNEKMKTANIPAPQVTYLGSMDNNLYNGLVLTFASADEVTRAENINAFPLTYKLDFYGETKNLHLAPKVNGNVVELSVEQDAADFPEDSMARSKAIIEHRISEKSAGMAEAEVRLDQNSRLNVQLPGLKTLQQAREIITATGRMTFRLEGRVVLDGTDLSDINVAYDPTSGYVIKFAFKGDGAKQLEKISSENVGKNMGIYLDETELMNPVIKSALPGGGQIEMPGTPKEEIEKDALLMKSGALPVSLKVVQSNQVAPTLGKEIVQWSLYAGIVGILLVMAFMVLFYSLPGLLSVFSLALYGALVLSVMVLLRGVLTLPGIAGFILSLGMAVDANIIIFERIKDELRNGKRLRPAIQGGFDRAYITILDSNITTLIAAGVLYFFGTGSVQGFAMTLSIGVVISMFTALFITKLLIEWRTDHDPDRYAKYFGHKEVSQ